MKPKDPQWGWRYGDPLEVGVHKQSQQDAAKVTREELDAQVAAFLERGGTIEKVPTGKVTLENPTRHMVIKKPKD